MAAERNKVTVPRWLLFTLLALAGATVVLVVLVFATPLLLFALMPYDFRTIDEVSVSDLATDTGLALPPDARITHFKEVPPIDPVWVARVEMPSSAEARLVASASAQSAATGTVSGAMSESTAWWRPFDVVLSRRYEHSESHALVTVVISRESGQTIAYIEHAVY